MNKMKYISSSYLLLMMLMLTSCERADLCVYDPSGSVEQNNNSCGPPVVSGASQKPEGSKSDSVVNLPDSDAEDIASEDDNIEYDIFDEKGTSPILPTQPISLPGDEGEFNASDGFSVNFAFDSSKVSESFELLAIKMAIYVSSQDNIRRILIVGHTDSVGPSSYNQGLSERRANSVKDLMLDHGVSVSILSIGMGESDLKHKKDQDGLNDKLEQSQNRRADILFERN